MNATLTTITEGLARLRAGVASRFEAMLAAPRLIRTEATGIVLGAEAIPAPVIGRPGYRR